MVKKRMLKLFVCVFAIGMTAGLAHADITSDLVGHWKLDGGDINGKAVDSSTFEHDATLSDAYSWETGMFGSNWLNFSPGRAVTEATSDYGAGGLMSDAKLTVACWYKNDNLTIENQTYFAFYTDANNYGYFYRRYITGPFRVFMKVNGVGRGNSTSVIITDTEWHHMAVVISGTSYRCYFDGVFVKQLYIGNRLSNWVGVPHFCMGSNYADTTNRPLYGNLDDVRIYDRLLTVDDIQELVDMGRIPIVDAGPMVSELWPGSAVTLQMDATVTEGCNSDPCNPVVPILTWSQISGPLNSADFSDTTILDPCVTFDVAGMYELQLSANDGEGNAIDDIVMIRFRSSNDPMAHWNMDEVSGLTVSDSVNDNDGTLAGDEVPGRVLGWVGSNALEFYGEVDPCFLVHSYVNINTDLAPDPNLDNIQYEISLAAWFKINDLAKTSNPAIISNSDTGWRLYVDTTGKAIFAPGDDLYGSKAYSTESLDDGGWHHVVGVYVYDGSKLYLYVDGQLDAVVDNRIERLLDTTDGVPVIIGACATSTTEVECNWRGMLDDVYVYDYAIDASQVEALMAMGHLLPEVNAGEDQTFYMQYDFLQLAGAVTEGDDPDYTLDGWTQVSCTDPCGVCGVATFDPCNTIEDPCATFSETGTYVLRLTASDVLDTAYDEVTITVEDPTCQDVIKDGLLKKADVSGPLGVPDCYVDIHDFAALAGEWLGCNDPQDADCEFLYD
jgi:concanavalin A-like lectin/glucanase superfamily protein